MRRIKTSERNLLDDPVRRAGDLKSLKDQSEADFKEHKGVLKGLLEDAERDKHRTYWKDGQDVVVAIKQRDNGIDSERLKKTLGAQAYNRLTSPALDMAKVEAAIALGELDPNLVAQCLKPSTEYVDVRLNKSKKRDAD